MRCKVTASAAAGGETDCGLGVTTGFPGCGLNCATARPRLARDAAVSGVEKDRAVVLLAEPKRGANVGDQPISSNRLSGAVGCRSTTVFSTQSTPRASDWSRR